MKWGALALTATLACWVVAVEEAPAGRLVRYVPDRPIPVMVRIGMTTEIVFPNDILGRTQPAKSVMPVEADRNRVLLQPRSPVEARVFIEDVAGNRYTLEVRTVPAEEDDSVVIIGGEPAGGIAGPAPFRKDFKELLRAMALGRAMPGFEVKAQEPPRTFYEKEGEARFRISKVYSSQTLMGYVVEIKNIAKYPVQVNPQEWVIKGLLAGAVEDPYLSPREPADSLEAYKGYPKETVGYLVIDASFVRDEWEKVMKKEEKEKRKP